MSSGFSYELCLPTNFGNIIVHEGVSDDSTGKWSVIVRTNVKDRSDAFRWKTELETRSNVKYAYKYCKQDPMKTWKGVFECACEQRDETTSNCPHILTMTIDKNTSDDDITQDYVAQDYLCEVTFIDMHNHDVTPRFVSVGEREAARREIIKLINSGMTPREAIAHMQANYPGYLPKQHVYYEVAKSLRIRQMRQELHLDDDERSPKKAKIGIEAKNNPKSPDNKKVFITNLSETLLANDHEPSTSKSKESDKIEAPLLLSDKYMTLPTLTRKPVPRVSIEQGAVLIQQIMHMMERHYHRYARDLAVRGAVEECYARLEQVRTRQQFSAFLRNAAQEIVTRYQGSGPLYYDTQKLAVRQDFEQLIEYADSDPQADTIEYVLETGELRQSETPGVISVD